MWFTRVRLASAAHHRTSSSVRVSVVLKSGDNRTVMGGFFFRGSGCVCVEGRVHGVRVRCGGFRSGRAAKRV